MEVLLVLACMAGAWWWAWRTMAKIARLKNWGKKVRAAACGATGSLSTFGAFCISGGLLLPDPTNAGGVVAAIGVLLLAPLAFVLWRASTPATSAKSVGSIAPRSEVAPPAQADVEIPQVGSSLISPSLPREFSFSYVDHQGQPSNRRVRVMGIASNDGRQYLDGYCLERNGMRTFRVDRVQGDLTDMETGELFNVYNLLAATNKRRHMDFTPAKPAFAWADMEEEFADEEQSSSVLFTGFAKAQREALEAAAEAAGWVVRSTVGSTLDYLVIGPRAGQSKVAKAEELGVCVIDEDLFLQMVSV